MTRASTDGSATLSTYLARLDAELASVPPNDREEILLETRSHVVERTGRSPGLSVEHVLAEFGLPEVYARRFLRDLPAVAHDTSVLAGLARVTSGGVNTLPTLMIVIGGYFIAALAFLMAIGKLVEPTATGLFIEDLGGHRSVSFVWSAADPRGRDVLGLWLVPLLLFIAMVIHLGLAALLRRELRRSGRRRSPR